MIGHKDFTTRPATRDDLVAFYGKPPGETVRALVAEYEGEVVAVGGVMIERGWVCAFSDFKAGLEYSPRAALRFAREVVGRTVRSRHAKVMSRTGNRKFLETLGFTHYGAWEQYEVYEWLN